MRLDQLRRRLHSLTSRGLKFAIADATNESLFEIRKEALTVIERKFILRNTWTQGSLRVNKATLNRLEGSVGSAQQYLRVQEEGGVAMPVSGLHGVPMPTATAAGQYAQPRRTKPVQAKYRMRKLTQMREIPRGNRQRTIAALHDALDENRRRVIADLGSGRAVFEIEGDERHMEVHMLYSLRKLQQHLLPRPWLQPATRAVDHTAIQERHLLRQIDRALRR